MSNSLPYQDFLISRLKDPNYAAVYLETHMELEENKELDPRLIKLALSNVALALGEQNNMASEQVKQHQEKLDALLTERADEAVYQLAEWLEALGLKLTVKVACKQQDSDANTHTNARTNSGRVKPFCF